MTEPAAAQRIRAVLDMDEFAEQMYRAKLLRERREATRAEIDAAVNTWRVHRPGAPTGGRSWPAVQKIRMSTASA